MTHGSEPRILLFAPSFRPAVKAGGPARGLSNLVCELNEQATVDVITRDRDLGDTVPFTGLSGHVVKDGTTAVYYINEASPSQWTSLVRRIARRHYDLIMLNSVWDATFALAPALLHAVGLLSGPILLLPHGELEPGALALKARKKGLAAPFVKKLFRDEVAVFGATSTSESENIARWFPGRHVIVTSNNHPDQIEWNPGRPATSALRLLYLSRISRKKGLLSTVRGLRTVTADVRFQIAGPIEDDEYWRECCSEIARLPRNIVVEYVGVARRSQIEGLLWATDCVVLLTAGENYGHVIAEALQAGCPVITTPTTPFTTVIRNGGGVLISNRDDADEIGRIVTSMGSRSPGEIATGRREARRAFDLFAEAEERNIVLSALDYLSALSGHPLGDST